MAKIRLGFISNSSSSSFVVCKAFLTQKQIDGIKKFYENLGDDDVSCGESGKSLGEDSNYLNGETYYISDEWEKLVKKLKLDESKMFWDNR